MCEIGSGVGVVVRNESERQGKGAGKMGIWKYEVTVCLVPCYAAGRRVACGRCQAPQSFPTPVFPARGPETWPQTPKFRAFAWQD